MKTRLLTTHPPDFASLVTEGIAAIREAIVDSQQHHQRYRAIQGQPHTTQPGNKTYTFQLEDNWEPHANAEIRIELDPGKPEQAMRGTILSAYNTSITLVTERPLPHTALAKMTFFEATTWLLEQLLSALRLLQEQGETSAQMGAKTFGLLPCHEARGNRQAQIATFLPDEDQTRAIEVGIASERLILVGPPGTGKTSVQCALILEHLLAGKTVLLATPTHVALDNAMKQLKQYCEQSGNAAFIQEHQVVRIGIAKELTSKDYQDITLQGIVDQQLGERAREREALQQEQSDLAATLARLARGLAPRKQRWMQQKATLQARLETNRQEHASCEMREKQRLTTIESRLHVIREEKRVKQEQQNAARQAAQMSASLLPTHSAACKACELALQSKENELASFRTSSFLDHLLAHLGGVTKQSLMAERELAQTRWEEAQQIVITHERRRDAAYILVADVGTELLILEQEAQRLLRAQQQETDDAKYLQMLATKILQDEQQLQVGQAEMGQAEMETMKVQRRYDQVTARLHEIEDKQRVVISQVIANAKVVGTTLTGITTSPYLRGRLFDVVLIDEASMVSLAVMLIAATRARKSVLVFGDPNQLSPIVQLSDKKAWPNAAYWLGTNLFSHLHITLEDADAGRKQVVFLSQQSRMVPEIAITVSQFIYGGRLKNRVAPDRIPLQLAPSPASPLLLIDTSDIDRGKGKEESKKCLTKQSSRGSSKYNDYHVGCVVQVVRLLLAQLPEREEPQIGVVTPYGAQKLRIRASLQDLCLLHLVHVGTVHSFQSVEYPCIIFDTTEGPGVPIRQFTSNTWGRDGIPHEATRLLNVAHSRARDKLIYIANVEYITERYLPQTKRYRQNHLLTHIITAISQQERIASHHL